MTAWITLPIVVPFGLTIIFLLTMASRLIEISRLSAGCPSTRA